MIARSWTSARGPRVVLELGDEERVLSVEKAVELRDGISQALCELAVSAALATTFSAAHLAALIDLRGLVRDQVTGAERALYLAAIDAVIDLHRSTT